MEAANSQSWLTGEEASVAFKDVVFLPLRLQHCRYDTNLGGQFIFDLAFRLHPEPGLWYGRQAKAVLMALAVPLTFLCGPTARPEHSGEPARRMCLAASFPGFSSLLVAGHRARAGAVLRRSCAVHRAGARAVGAGRVAGLLLGLGLLVYGGGAAFVPPVFALVGLQVFRERPASHGEIPRVVALAVFAAVLAVPLAVVGQHVARL